MKKRRIAFVAVAVLLLAGCLVGVFLDRASRPSCGSNLIMIDCAKEQCAMALGLSNGANVTAEQIQPYLDAPWAEFVCPQGGTYTINPIGTDPTCSIRKHKP